MLSANISVNQGLERLSCKNLVNNLNNILVRIQLSRSAVVTTEIINTWTIKLSINDLSLLDELKSNFSWWSSVYKADITKPKINGKWQMGYQKVQNRLFKTNHYDSSLYFEKGFAPYIRYQLFDYLDEKSKIILDNTNPFYEELNFESLYDYQNEDIDKLYRYKSGLFSTRTGYGRICRLS
jgi:hypothetical protein